jgi:hypothetical protein
MERGDQVNNVSKGPSNPACPLRSDAKPFDENLLRSAFTSDDLPVPRAPVSNTLLAVSPSIKLPGILLYQVYLIVYSLQVER